MTTKNQTMVHCDDHFFIFISFQQFIYDLFHISLTLRALFCLTLFECYIFFAIERFRITFKVNGKRQIKGENFSKKIVKNKIKNTKK